MDLHARRADSFGARAQAYAEHRPDYPVAAIRWALEPLGTNERLDVLDLAAGTGKLTAGLVAEGHRVTAVEPNEQMLSELVRRVHDVRALPGHAEHIPVPDGTVDAVFVGQAFHWFDQERALPEIARVLRPGGVLAALWNADDDRVEWIAELGRVSGVSVSFVHWPDGDEIAPHPDYAPLEQADFPHRQPRTVESLTATVATHSRFLVLEPAERERALNLVRDYLRSRPETANGSFSLRIVTRVQRCVRLAHDGGTA